MSTAPGPPAHLRPGLVALVALGGLVGAPLRYVVAQWLPEPGSGWPVATWVTNLAGALLLGLLLEALARRGPDTGGRRALRLALGTGVLGAFTTYSALAVEADDLLSAGRPAVALAYALSSVVGGLLAAAGGVALGALAHRPRARRGVR